MRRREYWRQKAASLRAQQVAHAPCPFLCLDGMDCSPPACTTVWPCAFMCVTAPCFNAYICDLPEAKEGAAEMLRECMQESGGCRMVWQSPELWVTCI